MATDQSAVRHVFRSIVNDGEPRSVILDVKSHPRFPRDYVSGYVIIDDVPAGSRFSAGEQKSETSWSVAPADLDGLEFTPPAAGGAAHLLSISVIAFDTADHGLPKLTAKFQLSATVPEAPPLLQIDWKPDGPDPDEPIAPPAELTEEIDLAPPSLPPDLSANAAVRDAVEQGFATARSQWLADQQRRIAAAMVKWQAETSMRVSAAEERAKAQHRAELATIERFLETEESARWAAAEAEWRAETERQVAETEARLTARYNEQLAKIEARLRVKQVQRGNADAEPGPDPESGGVVGRLDGLRRLTGIALDRRDESARMDGAAEAALKMRHAEDLAKLRVKLEGRHADDLAAQRLQHSQEIAALRDKLTEAQTEALTALRLELTTEHAREMVAAEERWLSEMDQRLSSQEAQLAARYDERLTAAEGRWKDDAETRRQAQAEDESSLSERLDAELFAARQTWMAEMRQSLATADAEWAARLEQGIAAAQAEWRAEEAERLAAAHADWATGQVKIDGEAETDADTKLAALESHLKTMHEMHLAGVEATWRREEAERLAAAETQWRAGEEARLAAAKSAWRRELEQQLEKVLAPKLSAFVNRELLSASPSMQHRIEQREDAATVAPENVKSIGIVKTETAETGPLSRRETDRLAEILHKLEADFPAKARRSFVAG